MRSFQKFLFIIIGSLIVMQLVLSQAISQAQTTEIAPLIVVADNLTPFKDIQYGTTYYNAARYLKNTGVINGYSDGNFQPDKDINRAEFVKIILEADKSTEIKYDPKYSFPDVSPSIWFAKYVSTAKRLGIIKGYPDGNFKPEQKINYPESFKIVIERFKVNKGETISERYSPFNIQNYQNTWFYPYLDTANATGLFDNYYDFVPGGSINRGEAADIIYRTLNIKKTASPVFYPPSLYLGDQNGLLITNLKAPYRLPVTYSGINEPLHIKLFAAPVSTFLASRSSTQNFYWNRYVVPENLKKEMKTVKEFTASIIPIKGEYNCKFCPQYLNEKYQTEKRGYIELPISEKNLYFLEIDGQFLPPHNLFLDVTDHTMLARQGKTDNLTWLVNENDGKPVSGATIAAYKVDQHDVKIYDTDKNDNAGDPGYNKISSTLSDENGLMKIKSDEANFFVAEKDGNLTILGTYRYVTETNTENVQHKIYTYTDRPIYRPGQAVNFKTLIRRDNSGIYELPSKQEVTFTVTNYLYASENKVYEKKYSTSPFGNIDGSFNLSSQASTGSYAMSIKFSDGSIIVGSTFQVEAYKKDEYELIIKADKDEYIEGDTVKATISGQYFFGAPVTNQEVKYTVYSHGTSFPPPCSGGTICPLYHRYEESFRPYPYYGKTKVTEGNGTLDQNGNYSLSFKASLDQVDDFYREQNFNDSIFSIEVESIDSSNIMVNASKDITVHGAEFALSTKDLTTIGEPNKPYQVEIETKNHQGSTYANASLSYKITEQTYVQTEDGTYYDYWLEKPLPYYRSDYNEKVIEEKSGIKTNSEGKYILTFTPNKSANYQIEITATDSKNHKVKTSHTVEVNGDDHYSIFRYNPEIIVESDKELYEENGTARVKITSSVANSFILVTTAKDDIISTRVVKLEGKTYSFDLPLTSSLVPNIMLYVDGLNESHDFVSSEKNLKVLAKSKQLSVTVTPGKSISLPEETVNFTITTKDQNGNPVAADVSFALIDKAIFKLLNITAEDIHFAFYAPRYYSLSYSTTPKTHIEKNDMKRDGNLGYAESTDSAVPAPMAPALAPQNTNGAKSSVAQEETSSVERKDFLDTAYWVASAQTDNNGKATITVKLPHNLTTWVGTAIANTSDTKVGMGNEEIITTKNLIISPLVPRFTVENDKLTLRAQVRNNTVDSSEFSATLSGDGFSSSGKPTQDVTLAKGENKTIEFPITITGKNAFNPTFKLAQKNGNQNDTVTLNIPINPYGVEKTTAQSGEDNATINLSATSGNLSNIRSIKLTLAPTLADSLVQSIEYLVGYPYGCVEQTMSSFLPDIIVYANRDKLKFKKTEIFKDLDKQVEKGLQRLYSFQHSDGGWGWWENDESSPKNTAYVMYGLTMAKKAGFAVNADIYKQGHLALESFFYPEANKKFYPYILYVLSQVNEASFEESSSCDAGSPEKPLNPCVKTPLENRNKTVLESFSPKSSNLKTIDLAYLALAHHNLGNEPKAKEFLQALKSKATIQGDRAFFDEKTIDYESMSSDSLTTAMALEAFAQIDVANDIVPKIIRYFNQTNRGYYNETHSTAHAVIALASYITHTSEITADYTYSVNLNGSVLASGKLETLKELEIPVQSLDPIKNTLTISKNGIGKLYYSFVQQEFVPKDTVNASNEGFKIERSYLNKSGDTIEGSFKTGEIVRVNLKVTNPSKYFYTAIIDRLPAGLEPVNSNLAKDKCFGGGSGPIIYLEKMNIRAPDGGRMPAPDYYPQPDNCQYFQGEYTDNRDLLDDRTVMFRTNLEPGEHEFSYFARAVTPGTFHVNPASAEMMYAPEINGRTAGSTLTIE